MQFVYSMEKFRKFVSKFSTEDTPPFLNRGHHQDTHYIEDSPHINISEPVGGGDHK